MGNPTDLMVWTLQPRRFVRIVGGAKTHRLAGAPSRVEPQPLLTANGQFTPY